jgi:sec-independent protein translocase protein TatA
MGMSSIWHWLIVLLVIVLLFGAGRISGVMGDLGKGLKSFKKGLNEDDEDEAKAKPAKPAARLTDERAPDQARSTSAVDIDKA